jgi:hypothetical protein
VEYDRLYREDKAVDGAFRINWFLHPHSRLSDDSMLEERAGVLYAYSLRYPESSYFGPVTK